MSNTINVKFQEQFKLYVLFQDNIIFEGELQRREIDYYYDPEQLFISESIRYFLLEKDNNEIDLILKQQGIIGSIESLGIQDFRLERKVQYLYFKIAIVFLIIISMVSFILDKIS